MSRTRPATPRVISPSPTPSERMQQQDGSSSQSESYFGPVTRSAARKRLTTPQLVEEDIDEDEYYASNPGYRRSRTRSRSPIEARRIAPLTTGSSPSKKKSKSKSSNATAVKDIGSNGKSTPASTHASTATSLSSIAAAAAAALMPKGTGEARSSSATTTNGHLAPPSATSPSSYYWSWRDFSRSPSPLGLIPIHRHWRSFVHKHEVPRKLLHVSIGFFVVWLYLSGTRTSSVPPYLMAALVPISAVDILRHHHQGFNRFYVMVLGALMRESEYAGYNGVIFYLLGAWVVLYAFPKDVGVVGTLLLSWCDTAASTFGRLYGAYTPRIRRGKSLAGSSAAFLVGVATAAMFWGWLAPRYGPFPGDDEFMFRGTLRLPATLATAVGLSEGQSTIGGALALGVMSVWSGLVAAASEVVDIFGWDDNLTIPVLSGAAIWGFLKVFG